MTFKKLAPYLAAAAILICLTLYLTSTVRDAADQKLEAERELNNKVVKINENSNRDAQRSTEEFDRERREANARRQQ